MKTLLLVCGIFLAGAFGCEASSIGDRSEGNPQRLHTRIYSRLGGRGEYADIYDYIPDLFGSGFNDDIESVLQTGMWMYYENNNYNVEYSGRVYFVHGIDLRVDFPSAFRNAASSIRYAGDRHNPNGNTWTLFDGEYFSGQEFFGVTDAYSLQYLDLKASSLVITGSSPWTIYSGQGYSGDSLCVYPTDHDTGSVGDYLDFGIYPTMSAVGIPDNTIRSLRQGCWSKKIAQPPKIEYEQRSENGGWGFADLPK
ncbi:uncharacterized protein LOC135200265 [Macrobrachium nipponense]|uniref:uncharacterized protein LOC135200265 n=1 Tax=Macrobrachium nipponense TaxID=159736 RepID=UPI0030C859C6